jgi:hypothetical protein
VILVHTERRQDWRLAAVPQRLRGELAKRAVRLTAETRRRVELGRGERGGVLGWGGRRGPRPAGDWRPPYTPQRTQHTALLRELLGGVRGLKSPPVEAWSAEVNPTLRGGVNSLRSGQARQGWACVRPGLATTGRRRRMRARHRRGVGWKRGRTAWLCDTLGRFGDDRGRSLSRA